MVTGHMGGSIQSVSPGSRPTISRALQSLACRARLRAGAGGPLHPLESSASQDRDCGAADAIPLEQFVVVYRAGAPGLAGGGDPFGGNRKLAGYSGGLATLSGVPRSASNGRGKIAGRKVRSFEPWVVYRIERVQGEAENGAGHEEGWWSRAIRTSGGRSVCSSGGAGGPVGGEIGFGGAGFWSKSWESASTEVSAGKSGVGGGAEDSNFSIQYLAGQAAANGATGKRQPVCSPVPTERWHCL